MKICFRCQEMYSEGVEHKCSKERNSMTRRSVFTAAVALGGAAVAKAMPERRPVQKPVWLWRLRWPKGTPPHHMYEGDWCLAHSSKDPSAMFQWWCDYCRRNNDREGVPLRPPIGVEVIKIEVPV